MDDFRVGSVPSSEPFGNRRTPGSITRKRQKHADDEDGQQQDDAADPDDAADAADIIEVAPEDRDSPADESDEVQDYYVPSDPNAADE